MSTNVWKENVITIQPGQVFTYNLVNREANVLQIVNRTISGGGRVFADRKSDLSSTLAEVHVEQGNSGALVKPYALQTVYLSTDAGAPISVIVTEIVADLQLVYNASQLVQIQGNVQVAQPVQISGTVGISGNVTVVDSVPLQVNVENEVQVKGDAANPVPVTAGGYTWQKVTAPAAGTITVKNAAGRVAMLQQDTGGAATIQLYDGNTPAWKAGDMTLPQPIACATSVQVNFSAAGSAWIAYI